LSYISEQTPIKEIYFSANVREEINVKVRTREIL